MDIFVLNQSFWSVCRICFPPTRKLSRFSRLHLSLGAMAVGITVVRASLSFLWYCWQQPCCLFFWCVAQLPGGALTVGSPFPFCDSALRAEYWRRISAGVNRKYPGDVAGLQYTWIVKDKMYRLSDWQWKNNKWKITSSSCAKDHVSPISGYEGFLCQLLQGIWPLISAVYQLLVNEAMKCIPSCRRPWLRFPSLWDTLREDFQKTAPDRYTAYLCTSLWMWDLADLLPAEQLAESQAAVLVS